MRRFTKEFPRDPSSCLYGWSVKLVVAVFVVVFFARMDRHAQPVFFRRQRTSGIRSDRARWVVGPVEVEHHRPAGYRAGLQKAPAGISLGLAGGIAEDEEQ